MVRWLLTLTSSGSIRDHLLFNQMVIYICAMLAPDRLSSTFQALADPTRRAILARLSKGEASVTQLAEPFSMSMPAISKHLKVLERANLISRGKEAQWRPCKLEAAPLQQASDWVEQYRAMWEARFDRLDACLKEVQAKGKKATKPRMANGRKKS